MKARLLKKLMNNTGYFPNNNEKYIALGSPLCPDLISVDKKTLTVKYALDTFNEGRKCLERKSSKSENELLFIWDKFHELIENGQIHDIINGHDEIKNKVPVWTFLDGQLIETHTDKYGYPNTTYDGYVMYENLYFKTPKEAIEKAIDEYQADVNLLDIRLNELKAKIMEFELLHGMYTKYVNYFKSLKNEKD